MNISLSRRSLYGILVGSSGLEPPTSRLSGARSNHLSYEPIRFFSVLFTSTLFCTFCSVLVEMMGIEPMTPCLQGRCSPSWATPPCSFISWSIIENRTAIAGQSLYSLTLGYSTRIDSQCDFCLHQGRFSIERRWSSRTFRYGYLVTT